MKRLLIVEDDPAVLRGLETVLTEEHFQVLTATDGERGLSLALRERIDLIILDLILPKKNGEEVCRELRANNVQTPILMLTSKKEEIDKIVGLEMGADDYMTKPFSVRELVARIKAILRRMQEIHKDLDELTFGKIHVDFRKQECTKEGLAIRLSVRELEVLKYLAQREGEVITREMLLDDVWGYEHYPTTRTVDNYILSLRKKLEDDPTNPRHILTIHTAGYKFIKA